MGTCEEAQENRRFNRCADLPKALHGRNKPCQTDDGSVADGDAGNFGALQRPAYRFGLIVIEAGEAGPE